MGSQQEQSEKSLSIRQERNTAALFQSEYRVFPLDNSLVERAINTPKPENYQQDDFLSLKEAENILRISREYLVSCIKVGVFEMITVEEFVLPKRSSVIEFYKFSLEYRKAWEEGRPKE